MDSHLKLLVRDVNRLFFGTGNRFAETGFYRLPKGLL